MISSSLAMISKRKGFFVDEKCHFLRSEVEIDLLDLGIQSLK
jgi:hypothetical protein